MTVLILLAVVANLACSLAILLSVRPPRASGDLIEMAPRRRKDAP